MNTRILVNTKNIDHETWLAFRRKGIGGSDSAAVLNLSPWTSQIHVYLDKLGELPPLEDNERMRIGRDLEDYVAKRFAEATGMKVRRRNAMLQHPEHDFLIADVDRLIVGTDEGLECKVTNSFKTKEWEEDIPVHYEVQCHHYMAVTGFKAWWIAALIGNEKVVYKKIDRDEEIIDGLIHSEKEFWEEFVMKKKMPAPDGSKEVSTFITDFYPSANPEMSIQLDNFEEKIRRYDEVIEMYKALDKEKKKIEQEIMLEMQDSKYAWVGERKISRSVINRTSVDSKRLKKEMPDIFSEYGKQSTYSRLYL